MKINIGPYPKSSKAKRRVNIHIDPYDTWNMDATLALIIVPMLKQLKATKHGIPGSLVKGEDVTEEEIKEWDTILDKMILAFERISDHEWEEQFFSGVPDIQFVPSKNMKDCSEMVMGPKDTFKVDREGLDKAWAEVDEGLTLFGKYYRNLWD